MMNARNCPGIFRAMGPTAAPTGSMAWAAPAIVVPAGFYANGLPFGMEMSADYGRDGDLPGFADVFEQATHLRHLPPDKGRPTN